MNDSPLNLTDETLLDNSIWNSLVTTHAHLATGEDVGRGLARRYPSDIGPLSGLQSPTPEAYADLARIVPAGDIAVLFLEEPPQPPAGWQLLRDGALVQMMCPAVPEASSLADPIVPLGPANFEEMIALATLTEPGPFRASTASLGGFLGVRVGGRLAAMAGRRLSPGDFTEISAVCTHPDFRGRGYARALVAKVARSIYAEGRTPFLSAFAANTGAIRVYEQVGFLLRRHLQLAVVKPPVV